MRSLPKTLLALVVIAVALLTYVNTLNNGFILDDHFLIEQNPSITDFSNIMEIFTSDVHFFKSSNPPTDYYRPLLLFLYSIEYAIFGLAPWGWHLFNSALHAANSLLVFVFAHHLSIRKRGLGGKTAPFLAGLIFATHPVNTETVSWLACICELLYTFFTLLAIYLYLLSQEEGRTRRQAIIAISAISFLLAAFSKETALVLPLILIAADYSLNRLSFTNTVRRHWPFWAMAFLYFLLRTSSLQGRLGQDGGAKGVFFYFSNIITILYECVWKFLFPLRLSFYKYTTPRPSFHYDSPAIRPQSW